MDAHEHDSDFPWVRPRVHEQTPAVTHGRARDRVYVERDSLLPVRVNADPIDVGAVWAPQETAREIGTPLHRALATLVRAAPLIVLLLPATIAAAWALEWRVWHWFIFFPLVSIAAYLAMLWIDLVFNSPNANERHRITTAAQLKRMEMRNSQELRRMIVEEWLDRHSGASDSAGRADHAD